MFRVDMGAIREAGIEARLMANTANPANSGSSSDGAPRPLATFATLAVSKQHGARIDPAVTELLEAAMRVCNVWNDSAVAREQMRQDVLQTPPHLRTDLLEHFKKPRSAPTDEFGGCQRNEPPY